MKEKVLETDEFLKATTDAGEKGSICEEPKHQKLKLLVAELPTLVDSLTQDCRMYERSLTHERSKYGMMKGLCKSREREKKEVLKRKLELECELDAKKMRIEELTTKLEENVDEIEGLQDLNQQLLTKERLGNNDAADEKSEGSSDVQLNVADIRDDMDLADYDLSIAFSTQFYTEKSVGNWYLYVNREFVEEKNVDPDAFGRQNLITFLHHCNLHSTVSAVVPYCRRPVLEFYANLSPGVGDERSGKYGKVFVREKVYDFSPSVINNFYHTRSIYEEGVLPDVHSVTSTITGGLITHFPAHPQRLSASSLTSFYSVLHKLAIRNWTPSTNSTIVTRQQALILHSIGTNGVFNFGQLVFSTVLQYAEGGLKASKLPFPSLIYGILDSQGFVRDDSEPLSTTSDLFKISPAFFKGNRKVDLPWTEAGVAPGVVPSVGQHVEPPQPSDSDFIKLAPSFLHTQIDFALTQILHAKALIAYYEEQVANYRLLLDAAVHSGQKGGGVTQTHNGAGPSGSVTQTHDGAGHRVQKLTMTVPKTKLKPKKPMLKNKEMKT